jgi:integrase
VTPRSAAEFRAFMAAENAKFGELPAHATEAPAAGGDDAAWTSAPSIGRKVLRRIATVLRYAAAHGWRANDNPADARMLRHAGLPPLPGGRKQPSLPWAKLPAFVKALDAMPGLGALALRLVVLTALRSGEVRNARWSWLSFDGRPTLTVPGEAMKWKKSAEVMPHRVSLSAAALDTLARAYSDATGSATTVADLPRLVALRREALIFPSGWRWHDLRRTARTGMTRLGVPRDHAEAAINHVSGRSKLERIYDRHDYSAEIVAALTRWQAHVAALVSPQPMAALLLFAARRRPA